MLQRTLSSTYECIRSCIPRSVWTFGSDICGGMYTLETVYLRQTYVEEQALEVCHHLPVGVVGAPSAGKSSLIRKLVGMY